MLLTAFSIPAFAVDPTWNISEYSHKAWRFREGDLPGRPYGVAQTQDGFIWVGTHNGLLRFDGVRFSAWPPPADAALPSDVIYAVFGARDGGLWVGTERGITHVTTSGRTNFLQSSEADVHRVAQDSHGSIWLWHSGSRARQPLCTIATDQIHCFGPEARIVPQTVFSVLLDHEDYVWLGTSTSVLRWRSGELDEYAVPGLQHHTNLIGVAALAPDLDGSMLVGVAKSGPGLGLERLSGSKFSPVVTGGFDGSKVEVASLLIDRHGTTWIGTTEGLFRLRPGRMAEHFSDSDGLSGRNVRHLFEDREGTIWAVTENGVDNFRDFPVVSLGNRKDFQSTEVDGVLATRDGTLWVGGWETLYKRNPNQHDFTAPAGALKGKQVSILFEDSADRLWVGINDTLNSFTEGRFQTVTMPNGDPVGMIVSMAEDREHQLWAISLGPPRTVLRIDPTRYRAVEVSGVPPASKITQDPQEGVWLGLLSGELGYYRQGQLKRIQIPHDGPESRIKQLMTTPDGSIFAATDYGLVSVKQGRPALLSMRNSLPCSEVFASQFDASENLWLYMQCGLVEIDKAELARWRKQPDASLRTRLLDSSDGAQAQLTPFNPAARTPDGRLWFANNEVLQTLDPATAMRGGASAEVYIESLVADLKTFPLHDDPVVPALTRDVQIDYTTPNFTAPEKARFRYRLRGFDQDWKDAGTRRQAFYTHLPPRQYDFEVMTANSTGNWSANSATLRFAVAPALYQTLWFKILIAIALVLFAALFLALRIRQAQEKLRHRMEARNAERERIARDLHDTLLQGIHALAFRLETWATDPEIPMVQKREIETATSQTRSIIEEGREKILELRQTLARASDIAETLVASASVYSNGGHGSVLGVEVSGRARPLTAEAYEQLTAIGAEAIRNAYRHSGADIITFRLSYRRRALEMAIVDNGRGMTAAAQAEPGHYGMTGMRERATLLGATLTIESAPRRGTTIRIAVSRDAAYEL